MSDDRDGSSDFTVLVLALTCADEWALFEVPLSANVGKRLTQMVLNGRWQQFTCHLAKTMEN